MPFGAQGPPGQGAADSPQAWYMSLPLITRCWFTACVSTTILSAVGMISPMTLYLDWSAILFKFQIWRVVTNFCFLGKFGWPFIMNLIFMVQYSKTLEKDFNGSASDFLWCLIMGGALLCGINHVTGMMLPFLTIPLIFMTVWIWSRKHPNVQMSVFGLFNITSVHFPIFLLVLTMLMGGSPVQNIMGYFVGHVYWFLKEVHPTTKDHRFFSAPSFLKRLVEDQPLEHTPGYGGAVRRGGAPPWGGRGAAGQQQQQQQEPPAVPEAFQPFEDKDTD
uniref:Derlin n=1 Tax=Guillardia theta TaxID=55529 RepID=A1IVY4_GUITH|nr:Der1-like protein [Guillardia theta]